MGWKLLDLAHRAGIAGHISDRARLALFHMCAVARDEKTDKTPAAEYHGGHVELGRWLIGMGNENTQRVAANRAIAELKKLGLIEEITSAVARKKKRYRILVEDFVQPMLPVDNSELGMLIA